MVDIKPLFFCSSFSTETTPYTITKDANTIGYYRIGRNGFFCNVYYNEVGMLVITNGDDSTDYDSNSISGLLR